MDYICIQFRACSVGLGVILEHGLYIVIKQNTESSFKVLGKGPTAVPMYFQMLLYKGNATCIYNAECFTYIVYLIFAEASLGELNLHTGDCRDAFDFEDEYVWLFIHYRMVS